MEKDTSLEKKQQAVLANTLYMMSVAMDLMLRESDRRFRKEGARFDFGKKQTFTRYTKAVQAALILQEDLSQDIYHEDEKHDFRNIQIWQEEANELARLMLIFADRSADQDTVNAIFKFIREQPGEGIVDEKMLESFYLKKL